MKIYSIFTKTGKIDVPIKDENQSQAEAVAKNPVMDLMDKVRELTDLSNKLTKSQSLEIGNEVEKIEFVDVDGQKITLRKGGPGSGRHPEGGTDELASYKETGHTQATQTAIDESKKPDYKGPKIVDSTGTGGKVPHESEETANRPGRKDEETNKPASQKENEWKAPAQPEKEPVVTPKPKDPMADHKKIAMEHTKVTVPLKHQESAKAYINSDHFKEDVERHAENRANEIKNLGYAQGPHPAIRALNEHLHPMMNKAEFSAYDDIAKVGWTDEAREAAAQARKQGSGGNGIRNEEAGKFVNAKKPFVTDTGAMYGKTHSNGVYAVHSYGEHYPMYAHDGKSWHGNSDKFTLPNGKISTTTEKQKNYAKPTGDIKYHGTEEMKGIVSSNSKKFIDDLRDMSGKIKKSQ